MADGDLPDFHSRDSVANEEALPKEFADTETAYGGEANTFFLAALYGQLLELGTVLTANWLGGYSLLVFHGSPLG